MGIQEDLNSFIHKHKIEKGKPYSNTSLGNTKASFFISDDEYEQFLNLYSLALTNGISLHYTEKPIDPSPLRVDLDFRFPVEETNKYDENGNLKRIYTEEHVDKIVKHYLQIINMYIQVDDDKNLAYVMEKPKPSLNRNKIKDGIHIVFPHIIIWTI
jgi:hypothetical protein